MDARVAGEYSVVPTAISAAIGPIDQRDREIEEIVSGATIIKVNRPDASLLPWHVPRMEVRVDHPPYRLPGAEGCQRRLDLGRRFPQEVLVVCGQPCQGTEPSQQLGRPDQPFPIPRRT